MTSDDSCLYFAVAVLKSTSAVMTRLLLARLNRCNHDPCVHFQPFYTACFIINKIPESSASIRITTTIFSFSFPSLSSETGRFSFYSWPLKLELNSMWIPHPKNGIAEIKSKLSTVNNACYQHRAFGWCGTNIVLSHYLLDISSTVLWHLARRCLSESGLVIYTNSNAMCKLTAPMSEGVCVVTAQTRDPFCQWVNSQARSLHLRFVGELN